MILGDDFLKRSVKLLQCQKEMVVWWHDNKGLSHRKLAKMFHVSRRLIQFILDPEKHKKNLETRGDSMAYYNKEKNNIAVKKYREHKKQIKNTFMGHDIYAFKPSGGGNVAHVRIGGIDRRKTSIYKALGVEEFNAKDSGTGERKKFTEEELTVALKKIAKNPYMQEEKDFLMDCLNNIHKEGAIVILFE